MNIITITLNPAFDLHYTIPGFAIGEENRVSAITLSSGGKSVNISRALMASAIPSLAVTVLGKDNAPAFEAKLREEGIDFLPFPVDGRIRENITVHSPGLPETRISLDNFSCPAHILDEIEMALHDQITPDTVIALSGSLPRGIGSEEAIRFCHKLKALTRYLVVDSASLRIEDLKRISPWLIKPNEDEICAMLHASSLTEREMVAAAERLCDDGIAQVLLTLGGKGALYVGRHPRTGVMTRKRITSAPITPVSTVGAGDSTIAGFLMAFSHGAPLTEMLKTACAFGSAACLREGTAPPLPADIAKLKQSVCVTDL